MTRENGFSAADALRGAAVLGAAFSLRELAAVLVLPAEDVRVLLGGAIAAGLLDESGDILRFRDEEIRRELYESMPAGLRIALHRYAAKILDGLSASTPPERVARHLIGAEDEVGGWEADWLVEHVAEVYAREPETAVGLISQVVRGLDPDDPRYAALRDRLLLYTFELGSYEQAGRIARGILTRSEDPARVGPAVWVLALSLLMLERFDEALGLLEDVHGRAGIPELWRGRNDAVRAVVLQILGRLDEGSVVAESALAADVVPPDPFTVGVSLYLRSNARAAHRDTAGALADVDRALAVVNQDPELTDVRMLLLGNRYTYRFALGLHDGVVDEMRHVLTMAESGCAFWQGRVRRQAADLLYDLGHWDEAAQLGKPAEHDARPPTVVRLADAEWEAEQEPTPRNRARADWRRGVLDADPAQVLTAVEYFRAAGLRLDAGNALEDAAELFAQAGDSRQARETLVEALDVYDELGAAWDARRAASRLRAYDVRLGVRGSRARTGDSGKALTATEQRVAELAAEGYSNPDIAARMFLSRRTVDTHISNILAKLQIGSRREIRDRLVREES